MAGRTIGALLLLLLTLLGTGAAADDAPEALLERGLAAVRSGQAQAAQAALRDFLAAAPEHPRRSEAWLALGRLALERGAADEALLFAQLIPADRRTPATVVLEGAALIAAGRAASGLPLLQALPQGGLDLAEEGRWLQALAAGQRQLGRPLEALVLYQRALDLPLPGATRDALQLQAHAMLRDECSAAVLEEAAYLLRGSLLGLDVRLQQAQRAAQAGAGATARGALEEVLASRLPFRFRDEALLLRDRLAGKAWLQRAVGVILPLSGRYAPFGNQVRRGIEQAAAEQAAAAAPVTFIFRDVAPEGEENARAVARLANEDRVLAVIGPLTGGAAPAAAQQAEAERLPLLALSQKDGLPEIGPHVFRNALTPRQQARALVKHAVASGVRRFAILNPENRLGEELAEAFAAEVAARGGQVVARQSYGDKATDFRRQVKLLLGEDPEQPDSEEGERALGSLRAAKRKGPPPPFEALFLPDVAERVLLLAPQLAFYGLEGVQLLGSNGWNDPELPQGAGRFVEGAVFVDGFSAASPAPAVRDFVRGYRARHQGEPSILEAQGYDSAALLLTVLARPEVRSRDDLRQALSRIAGYAGVMGTIDVDPQSGEVDKSLLLLRIRDGAMVPLP